ncbi:MAG TPA: MFS transporter [Candidatus Omnitrophota bacterium]|nr:MFS transporter [Candidatus Omnitrophota bacterium]
MKKSTFVILCLEAAVLSFNVAAAAALVPSIAKEFVLSQFFVGRIVWLYMLSYGLAALIYGPLVRAFDAKIVEFFCLFLFSLSNLLAALSRDIYLLFTARVFMGFFGASVIPLGMILISRHIESSKRGRFVGIFFSATFVASLIGLFLSGILPWRLIFLIPAICGFILCFFVYRLLPSFKEAKTAFKFNYLQAFKDKRVIRLFTYISLTSIFYHGVQQWLGVYFSSKFNFSQFIISMLITLTSLSGIFGEVFGGLMSDYAGRLKTVNLGIILMSISAFLLIFKAPLIIFVVLMVVWGLGWAFNHAGLSTMLTDLPGHLLNESASLNSSLRFLSGGLGAALAGLIMQKSFSAGFLIFGIGLVLLLVFSKRLLFLK